MRLVIDDDRASSSNVGSHFTAPTERDGLVCLHIYIERQKLDNWCWAAIASAVGCYYEVANLSQDDVAAQVFDIDRVSLGDEGVKQAVDRTTHLDDALRVVGAFSHWMHGKPLFDRVRYEINAGRPLAARIGWHAGTGHYVLVHGYREVGARVLVADPLHGEGEHALADFPRSYRSGGTWTETFWTDPPGRPGIGPTQPPIGSRGSRT